MINLESAGKSSFEPSAGILRRQSRPPTTTGQTVFDVLFGVLAPILCFVFDPGILKSGGFGFGQRAGIFPDYQGFVYLVSGIEILLLIVWLAWGRRLQPAHSLAGGALMAGAIFSGLIGLVLLPFTLMGLALGIGIFGFIPFLTALVYLRNARSAFRLAAKPSEVDQPGSLEPPRQAPGLGSLRGALVATLIGCVMALGPPAVLSVAASMFVTEAMNAVLSADEQQADLAIDEIRYLQIFAQPQLDRLVSAYLATDEPARKEALRRRYVKLTGSDIEQRAIIND